MSKPSVTKGVIQPPVAFAVKDACLVEALPNGVGEIWSAQVKAVRRHFFCKVFTDILFIEANGVAHVLGMESLSGQPFLPVSDDVEKRQKKFVHFLREQTQQDRMSLGLMAQLFSGYEFRCEAAATAAYVVTRDVSWSSLFGHSDKASCVTKVG